MNLDAHFLRHEARGCVIREEHGAAHSREDREASSFARIEGVGQAPKTFQNLGVAERVERRSLSPGPEPDRSVRARRCDRPSVR